MSSTDVKVGTSAASSIQKVLDMNIEVLVFPVSDVDRAKDFYGGLGWRLDADITQRRQLEGCKLHRDSRFIMK